MIDDRTFDYILDLCANLDISTLQALIDNIEVMIENKEEEEGEE